MSLTAIHQVFSMPWKLHVICIYNFFLIILGVKDKIFNAIKVKSLYINSFSKAKIFIGQRNPVYIHGFYENKKKNKEKSKDYFSLHF